jgi:hypothetical protein
MLSADDEIVADLSRYASEITDQTLAGCKRGILLHLSYSVDLAVRQLGQAAQGQSVFHEAIGLKAALALLKLAPLLVKVLPEPQEPEEEEDELDEDERLHPTPRHPRIPMCPFCKAGPASHWAKECGQNPDPQRWRYDAPLDHEWPEIRELQRLKQERERKEEQQRAEKALSDPALSTDPSLTSQVPSIAAAIEG